MAGDEVAGQEQIPDADRVPPFVVTDADRARWAGAGELARALLEDEATPEQVWSMQRVIYHDRESYPS